MDALGPIRCCRPDNFERVCKRYHTTQDRWFAHTLAMMIRSERPFEISFAISIGLVSQLVPLRFEPSGRVTSISSRGWAEDN